uniref:Uncharacterized protein n=1 Tax=Zea mays TaxID=4577 RepID=A0A804QVC6_MAIZE
WGEQATSFPADQISIAGQDSLQIIIFVGTLARSYAGTTSLTGGSSCKWYVNPQVPEATSLAASLQHKGAQLCLLLVRRSVCRGFLPLSIRKYLKSNTCIHSSMR